MILKLTRPQRTELNLPDLTIYGGKDCEAVTTTPADGEGFTLGRIAVKGLRTPCHTQDSICWFLQDGDDRVVFTGDTLFHGGCGKFFEGTGAEMHQALNVTLASLPDDTRVFVRAALIGSHRTNTNEMHSPDTNTPNPT